jgi:hypothetical protein
VQEPADEQIVFRYLRGTTDFEHAKDEGFKGYPAFDLNAAEHKSNVLNSFLRRVPPRKREDFPAYLARHNLPANELLSDMALLAYTNAKLPSDGFELYADLSSTRPPFELVIEVAGFRHQDGVQVDDVYVGDPVILKAEPDNAHDKNAVAIFHNGIRIGYVDRAQAISFQAWFRRGFKVSATVERINGKPERPMVYLFVSVR